MKLTKHFKLSEFESNDGAVMPINARNNIKKVAESLEELRGFLDCAIYINSAYRSPEWNKAVGGARHSQHVLGNAVDLRSKVYTPKQLYKVIEDLIITGHMEEGGLGLYDTFVHYDRRGTRARWDKTTK